MGFINHEKPLMYNNAFPTAPSSQLLLVPPARYLVKILLCPFRAEGERLLSPDDW